MHRLLLAIVSLVVCFVLAAESEAGILFNRRSSGCSAGCGSSGCGSNGCSVNSQGCNVSQAQPATVAAAALPQTAPAATPVLNNLIKQVSPEANLGDGAKVQRPEPAVANYRLNARAAMAYCQPEIVTFSRQFAQR